MRKFLKDYNISIQDINDLFYIEDGGYMPLYEDLKTVILAEGQIRIALLGALKNALSTGDYNVNIEDIRTESKDRKMYSGRNFTANFKNNKDLFDFDEWIKDETSLRLSSEGKKKLAEVIADVS